MVWILNNIDALDCNDEIHNIITSLKIKEENIQYLTYDNEILNTLKQKTLFNEYELRVIKDCSFLSNQQKIKSNQELIEYIKQDSCNYILITNKKNVLSDSEETIKIIDIKPLTSFNKKKYIQNYLKTINLELDQDVIDVILLNTNNDQLVIKNEINKIFLLKKSNVSNQELIQIISNHNNQNIFELLESVIYKNKNKIFNIIDDLKKMKQDEIVIIASLSYQLNQLILFKKLNDKKYSPFEIQKTLSIQPFIATKLNKLIQNITIDKLIDIMDDLYLLELNIKTMKVEKEIGLKNFLINISMD